ncbi:hypothetical protein IAT38_003996 [Cryptococcus sp. DSM 104549]
MLKATVLGPAHSPGQLLHAHQKPGPSRDPLQAAPFLHHLQRHDDPDNRDRPLGRTLSAVPRQDPHADGWAEEELVWYERTVVWSRGAEVFRRYTFEQEGEDVGYAAFVWFKMGGEGASPDWKKKDPGGNGTGKGTFGPFHHSQSQRWGGPQAPSQTGTPPRLERTLVVFLQTRAHVYCASGEDITVHLPFTVDGAWSLPDGGVVVQRALEKRELRRFGKDKKKAGSVLRGIADQTSMSILDDLMDLEDESAPSLPRLYALENPFDELKMIVEGKVEGGFDPSHRPAHLLSMGHPIDAPYSILHITPHPNRLVIAYNRQTSEITFYRAVRLPVLLDAPPPLPPRPRHLRPDELLRQPEPTLPLPPLPPAPPPRAARPSLHRNTSSFGPLPTGTDRRLSSAADPMDRTQRRAPRLSRGPVSDPASTDELQAALEPASGVPPATIKRRSRGMSILSAAPPSGLPAPPPGTAPGPGAGAGLSAPGAGPEGHRRTSAGAASFMLSDIHLPSRTKMALHGAAEKDLRETTMMMGLERDEVGVRSEVVLDRVWSWRVPVATDPDDIKVFVSDDYAPNNLTINIHTTPTRSPPKLYRFEITPSPGGMSLHIKPSLSTPALSAIPVLSTRASLYPTAPNSDIYDTLVLPAGGGDPYLLASGSTLPLAIPRNPRAGGEEVASRLARSLSVGSSLLRAANGSDEKTPMKLVDPVGPRFTAVYADGESTRLSAFAPISDELTQRCLEALATVLPGTFAALQQEVLLGVAGLGAAERGDGEVVWGVFETVVRGMVEISGEEGKAGFEGVLHAAKASHDPVARRLAARVASRHPPSLPISSRPPLLLGKTIPENDTTAGVLLVLHLVAQDCRLSMRRRKGMKGLVGLVSDLAMRVGRADWFDYWERVMPRGVPFVDQTRGVVFNTTILDTFPAPPDILHYLSRAYTSPGTTSFPRPGQIHASRAQRVCALGFPDACPQISKLMPVYRALAPPQHTGGAPRGPKAMDEAAAAITASLPSRAEATLRTLIASNLGREWLADLPYGVALPIWEVLRAGQFAKGEGWSEEMCMLVGRGDLGMKVRGEKGLGAVGVGLGGKDDWPAELGPEKTPTVRELMVSGEAGAGKKARASPIMPHVRFGTDRRLQEVERILQTTTVRTISMTEPKGASDADIARYQQSFVNTIANRTLAITVGQGMFEYGTRSTDITDIWEIPLIELSVKISPDNTLHRAEISPEAAEWPCFHNGVSAGLSISPDSEGIDSSWIVFNRPPVLNTEHGGFLLGLGLTGHLRKLQTYHAFPLMEPRHDFTSVGLLLGLACSFAGSADMLITKVLSLHTHALLPLGSMELNASPIIQSTALLGLGLVYAGSRNLRMAEIALGEVGRKEMPDLEGFGEYQEAYALSAAMSFGLIMLGRGGSPASEVDRRMLGQLRRCISGDAPPVSGKTRAGAGVGGGEGAGRGVDTNVTGPGATLALGLMYLKTMRRDIADMLPIPQNAYDLDQLRPDVLLVRTLARALIMWDEIAPTQKWVDEQVPAFVLGVMAADKKAGRAVDLAVELAFLNVVAGACLVLGLKYAGTATELAHNTILSSYTLFAKAVASQSMSYEGKIRRATARQGLNMVTLALAAVMSGTGELGVLRRLRVSHGQEGAGVTYGSHMAMHMALGLLFLGRGQFTLGSSNLAIAAMAIAFFPRFLPNSSDNKAYPQAFRHLWALGVEARCLTARDVETLETVYLPVKLRYREGQGQGPGGAVRQQSLISPTQLASFDRLLSIEVDSPRYWPVHIDLTNPREMAALVRTRTIYVKRKAGFIDYDSDPKGNRSIFVRAGTMTGIETHYDLISAGAPPGVAPGEMVELMRTHSGAADLVGMARRFDAPGYGVDTFLRTVVLECLALDKPEVIPVYLEMYAALRRAATALAGGGEMEDVHQLAFVKAFYDDEYERSFAFLVNGVERRMPLVRGSFVNAAARAVLAPAGTTDERAVARAYLHSGVQAWQGDASALARYITRNNIPPLPLLEALRERVQEARMERLGQEVLELKMQQSAEAYRAALDEAYGAGADMVVDEKVGKVGKGWKLDSVREAFAVWTE